MSTDDLNGAEWAVDGFGAQFPILYTSKDPAVPKSFGVFNLFGDGLASASVFIITEGNEIFWKDIGKDYTHQVSGPEIVEQIERLNART